MIMTYLLGAVGVLAALALLLTVVLVLRSKKQDGDGQGWSMKYLWAVPLILVGVALVALFYHGVPSMSSLSLQSPSIATVVDAARNYWLWIFILWGIVAVFIAFSGRSKDLQWIPVGVVFAAFIVLPFIGWVNEPAKPVRQVERPAAAMVVPLASSPQSTWPKLVIPAGGRSETVPLPSGMRVIWAGYQFRNYTVYPDGRECAFTGTPCPNGGTGTYAKNGANAVNIVGYAFEAI